jgi:hypothetical protein
MHHTTKIRTVAALALGGLMLLGPAAAGAASTRIAQSLGATGADDDASGEVKLVIRDSSKGLRGKLEVKARDLEPERQYEIEIEGVRIGSLTTRRNGSGKAKFDSRPKPGKQLLGVDPRGKLAEVVSGQGATVLQTAVSASTLDPNKVRCCLPDDSGPECEDRTAAECSAAGGVDLGPGSCLPNPCSGTTPPPEPEDDIACCLPDDSGPECEDRTPAECSAQGGVSIGPGVCLPNPCSGPTPPPDDDIRCCLPDDSGPKCEDRTVAECSAQGGVNIGPGVCTPNPCLSGATTTTLPGATTTTTLPPAATVLVTCERRADRSRASVNGNNLASGTYRARITSGANTATTGLAPAVGDEVQFDFDSDPTDIAAGATAIGAGFIQGTPPQVTGEILDAGGAVVVSATATCLDR